MVKGKTLEISIEKLKYLFGLKTPGFEFNSIDIEVFTSQRSGEIYEYRVTFDINVRIEGDIPTVTYTLNKLESFFQDLLEEYTLSKDGQVLYAKTENHFVSDGHLLSLQPLGWESMNLKLEYNTLLED